MNFFVNSINGRFPNIDSDQYDLFKYTITLSLFFISLTGIFWPTFILLGAHTLYKVKFSYLLQEKVFIFLFIFFVIVKLLQNASVDTILMFRSSLGLYFFYFYFSYINKIELTKGLLWVAVLFIFIEFVFRLPDNLYNFMNPSGLMQAAYSRVAGFGNNSSITSSVLVIYLIALSDTISLRLKLATILAVVMCGSGVGFVGLLLYGVFEIAKLRSHRVIISFAAFGLLIAGYIFYQKYQNTIYSGSMFYKLSPRYFDYIFNSKMDEVRILVSNTNLYALFFGASSDQCIAMNMCVGGDFGWKATFQLSGLYGIAIYLYLFWRLMPNLGSRLFSYLSLFHYSILLFPGAQIFLGYLTRRKDPPNTSNLPTQ